MRFNTHDRTPKTETKKSIKLMLIAAYSLGGALLLFFAVAIAVYSHSIVPAILILLPIMIVALVVLLNSSDMARAYIEINGEKIHTVDYYFGVKKNRYFQIQDILYGEILPGSSWRVRGWRWSFAGIGYIVFRGQNDRYMFKILACPETVRFFEDFTNLKIN